MIFLLYTKNNILKGGNKKHGGITKEMTEKLISASEYKEFYQNNFIELSLSEYLIQLMEKRNMTIAQIARLSDTGDYIYKLIRGKKKNPSRDVLIRISIGMSLEEDEINKLMRINHFHELDARDKRDAVIIFSLNKSFNLPKVNEMLYELNLKTLDKDN